jgi:large subunit ribosomal protein L19
MTVTLKEFNHTNTKGDFPDIKPGNIVKVYQKITETKGAGKKTETKERIQIFEGLVIGRKRGSGINATITVRKISDNVGVERIFPLNSPTIEKIEMVKATKVRRAKLNYVKNGTRKAKAILANGENNAPKEEATTKEVKEVATEEKTGNKKEKTKEEKNKDTDR